MTNFSFKTAFRNARKNSVLSLAKLFGISVSSAVIIFAAAYVIYETSFDKCIPNYKNIYRAVMQGVLNGNEADFAVTSSLMADAILNEIPEVSESVRVTFRGNGSFKYENNVIQAGDLAYTDANFFEFFGLNIKTTQQVPFEADNHIAIAKSIAENHFGSVENALNKKVILQRRNCIITGVFDDFPVNFHLRTKIIQNIDQINPDADGWGRQNYFTYLKTNTTNIDLEELSFKLTKTVRMHDGEGVEDASRAKTWDDLKYDENTYLYFNAEPITDIHFSKHRFESAVTANKIYVYGAIIMAILILLISTFNFINLNIANLKTRFNEIGIRKSIGAGSNQVFSQLVCESALFWILGFGLGFLLFMAGKQSLLSYLEIELILMNKQLILVIGVVFFILLFFNLLSNSIPIFLNSKKQTLLLLKNIIASKDKASYKDSLIILQFVLSVFIILSSVFVQKQVNFLVTKDRGYNTENVIMMFMWDMNPTTRQTFTEKLKTHSAIKSVTTSDVYFGTDPSTNGAFYEPVSDGNYFHSSILPVDADFFETFNIKLKEGRFFEETKQSDFQAVLINETAASKYLKTESPIGTKLSVAGTSYTIVGIVKDFNFRSLYHSVQPLIIRQIKNFGNVFIKVNNNQITDAINIIQAERKNLNITKPFFYEFHDDVLAKQYLKDQQAKKLLQALSLISIIIACVGLYAISYLTIIKRTKEIGIRKVNGAKIIEVMGLLTKDFAIWVIIAFAVAAPLSYFVMRKWLQNFAYSTDLSWWVFALTGVFAITIALVTVSWQTFKAARSNPIEELRYE